MIHRFIIVTTNGKKIASAMMLIVFFLRGVPLPSIFDKRLAIKPKHREEFFHQPSPFCLGARWRTDIYLTLSFIKASPRIRANFQAAIEVVKIPILFSLS